jgi:PPOX class probable F420-dependent enzyme
MLSDERFVSLTTYRKNGDGVATTVWIARDGDKLIVLTPTDSYKVKRVRADPRVQLVPCNRAGKVPAGAVPVDGQAEVVDDPAETRRMWDIVRRKYGFEYKVIMGIERIVARGQKPRVILRITVPVAAPSQG